MADRSLRLAQNVSGRFFVDSTCTDCGLCPATAPATFRRDDEIGYSIVYRQPETAEEIQLARDAQEGCPTESIGDDGA